MASTRRRLGHPTSVRLICWSTICLLVCGWKQPIGARQSRAQSSRDLPFSSRLKGATRTLTPLRPLDYESETLPAPTAPAFRLVYNPTLDSFEFQTATIHLRRDGGQQVTLVGTVHIAEEEYYEQIEADLRQDMHDAVLYEMITSSSNVIRTAPEDKGSLVARERLRVPLQATLELKRMAMSHGLQPQLDCMDFQGKDHWYLADISRERLSSMQRERGEKPMDAPSSSLPLVSHLSELSQIFWDGFTSRGRILPKLFLSGTGLEQAPLRLLRLGMWLAPCPEAQLLLLDWARQYPPAGGFSRVLRSMVGALVHGDLLTLRKLAFAQMLTSSQGVPQPEVLVGERNAKVVLDVEEALAAGESRVAVLYGGLHIQDMERKLKAHLGFVSKGVTWRTAWSMPAYNTQRQLLVGLLCVGLPLLQLGVGAGDWSATVGEVVRQLQQGDGGGPTGVWSDVGLYILRHMYVYYGLTRWIVEWERRLFDGAAKLQPDDDTVDDAR